MGEGGEGFVIVGHELAAEGDVQFRFTLVGMKCEKAALGGAAFLVFAGGWLEFHAEGELALAGSVLLAGDAAELGV